jgi:hypothetical protein
MTCTKDCPICHGIGYVAYDVPDTHPDFGKMTLCPTIASKTWDLTLGISKEEGESLDWRNFKQTEPIKILRPVLTTLMKKGYGMLYIWGKPGLGKTMAVKSATIYAHYKHGMTARYATHATLFNWLRSAYDSDNGQTEYQRRLNELDNIKWLAVDEIGRDRANDFSKSTLSDILDKRYVSGISHRTVTIFIANSAPSVYLDDYQVDRIEDKRNTVVHITTAESFRKHAVDLAGDKDWWQKVKETNESRN